MTVSRRQLLQTAAAVPAAMAFPAIVKANTTRVRFILDWRFEGPAAYWLYALEKGLFRAQGLDVSIDVGAGSGAGVQRMAAGNYEVTHADFNTMIELNSTIPDASMRPMGFYVTYETSPATVFTLKSTGITKPKDLEGRKLGAPIFDGGRKAFPMFARANGIDLSKINWTTMDPPLRETMLARGEVEAITGFFFSGFMSLIARGVKEEDIVAMRYADHGALMYGNTAVTTRRFAQANPAACTGFARALNQAIREVLANPEEGIAFVKKREPLINEAIELRRLKIVSDNFVMTPTVRRTGMGGVDMARLQKQSDDFAAVMNLPAVPAADLFTSQFLPPEAERRFTA
jgi:NitT/TauT family transport system substrate-binding protein